MGSENEILVIDETERDALALIQSLQREDVREPVRSFDSVGEAQNYLRRISRRLPAAVVLALGRETRVSFDFIRWIRSQSELASLIVITLGSGQLREVQEAYASGANAYFIKGSDRAALARTLRAAFSAQSDLTHPAFRNSTDLYADRHRGNNNRMERPLLLVDDNEDHARQFEQGLTQLRLRNPARRVNNVDEAIKYLAGEEPFQDRTANPSPLVVFLDIRMPDSHRLLAWMEAHPAQKPAGIIALTNSHDMRPVIQAYHLGVHSFLKEPPKLEELRNALGAIPGAKLCEGDGFYWIQEVPLKP